MKAISLACLCCIALPAAAASVSSGPLNTRFVPKRGDPPVSSISQVATVTIDLSDLSGLVPGQDIQISFTTGEGLYWEGGAYAEEGDLTLQWQALLTITVGAHTASTTEAWSFGPVPWIGGAFVGYEFGPTPGGFSLIVPWGTDLSSVSLTLTDQLSVDGVAGRVLHSSLSVTDSTLTTTSIPEPSAGLLAILASSARVLRRRRMTPNSAHS
jgi:hypothetical protein